MDAGQYRLSGPRALFILAICVGLLSLTALGAQDTRPSFFLPLPAADMTTLELGLGISDTETLRTKGELVRFHNGTINLELCPSPELTPAIKSNLSAVKADLVIETLLTYPIPTRLQGSADLPLEIYNILHRFTSMQGIKYYSESRKAMRVFFTKSGLVQSPSKRQPIADPVYKAVEAAHTLYALQEDQTFGTNLYRVEVQAFPGGAMSLRMKNVEQVWYGIVPVLGAESLEMQILVIPRGKHLVFYGVSGLTVPRMLGIDDKAKSSFYNRIIALYSWFAGQIGT